MQSNSTWNPSSMLMLGLSAEDKDLIERAYTSCRPLIERIHELLNREVMRSIEEADNVSNFNNPHWDKLQAYLSGQRAAFKYLSKILNNKER